MSSDDESLEQYLLLLLSDSNLPSGGFVASSSLESYCQHGLLSSDNSRDKPNGVLNFIKKSVDAYASLNLVFVEQVSNQISQVLSDDKDEGDQVDTVLSNLVRIDQQIESMTLNHVAKRASTAQGVALLTLYERALAPVEYNNTTMTKPRVQLLIERLRKLIRSGQAFGHLSLGFAVLTSALGMSLGSSQHLFIFLHARSLLSSAVRLNIVGPYVAHRLLLHDVRPIVQQTLLKHKRHKHEIQSERDGNNKEQQQQLQQQQVAWWFHSDQDELNEDDEPATTWPLAEILAARHDQLHSKIFNS
ncbi:hypothetical protein OIO90_005966 [Microbotryomycetes sp. JL221]|nr:hypothetical protein OIO90_005966 [Microbotryomycetes sp. JL221]